VSEGVGLPVGWGALAARIQQGFGSVGGWVLAQGWGFCVGQPCEEWSHAAGLACAFCWRGGNDEGRLWAVSGDTQAAFSE